MREVYTGMFPAALGVRAGFPEGIEKPKDDIRQDLGVWHRKRQNIYQHHTYLFKFLVGIHSVGEVILKFTIYLMSYSG